MLLWKNIVHFVNFLEKYQQFPHPVKHNGKIVTLATTVTTFLQTHRSDCNLNIIFAPPPKMSNITCGTVTPAHAILALNCDSSSVSSSQIFSSQLGRNGPATTQLCEYVRIPPLPSQCTQVHSPPNWGETARQPTTSARLPPSACRLCHWTGCSRLRGVVDMLSFCPCR